MTTLWTTSDAWVLMTLDGSSAAEPVTLARVIAIADALQHAILSEAEFTQAAGRLSAAGLLATGAGRYWLTEAGQEALDRNKRGGRWPDARLPALRRLGPPSGAPLRLEPGAFDRAVDDYHQEASRR
ncbi:hypothetical protein [Actinoplanes sp. NPDC049118]|uniref:hypothetical protein n=1 Tax=Actinoplanes sp. NPDC049118 TaxID=3155769 RepID=UPI0033D57C68